MDIMDPVAWVLILISVIAFAVLSTNKRPLSNSGASVGGPIARIVARIRRQLAERKIEREYNYIFMTMTPKQREQYLAGFIKEFRCGRHEAMRIAIEKRQRFGDFGR